MRGTRFRGFLFLYGGVVNCEGVGGGAVWGEPTPQSVFSNRWGKVFRKLRVGIKAHPCAVIPETHVLCVSP